MEREQRTDRFTTLEDRFSGYEVYDPSGEKIGKVDDLFLDENDQPEYIGVKMGFLGTSSTLIPMDVVSVDETQRSLTVSQPKSTVQNGPAFDDDREITPEYEAEVRSFYGLEATNGGSGSYSDYYDESGAAPTGRSEEHK